MRCCTDDVPHVVQDMCENFCCCSTCRAGHTCRAGCCSTWRKFLWRMMSNPFPCDHSFRTQPCKAPNARGAPDVAEIQKRQRRTELAQTVDRNRGPGPPEHATRQRRPDMKRIEAGYSRPEFRHPVHGARRPESAKAPHAHRTGTRNAIQDRKRGSEINDPINGESRPKPRETSYTHRRAQHRAVQQRHRRP